MNLESDKFIVRETGKYGQGVFAAKPFHSGTSVLVFTGEVITFDEAIRRIHAGEESQTDSLQVDLEMDMDLDELPRLINHSCEPNSLLRGVAELVAIRHIAAGEEITYDYSTTVGPNIPRSLWEMPCSCGSASCRRVIGNILTLPKQVLAAYLQTGLLQDYIKRELHRIELNGGKLPTYRKIAI